MATNNVTLTATFQGRTLGTSVDALEGNFLFSPAGTLYDSTTNTLVAAQIQQGLLANGVLTVTVLASDNFASGVLNWDVHIAVRSVPFIDVPNVTVNFAAGANQNLFTVLIANGWNPTFAA